MPLIPITQLPYATELPDADEFLLPIFSTTIIEERNGLTVPAVLYKTTISELAELIKLKLLEDNQVCMNVVDNKILFTLNKDIAT